MNGLLCPASAGLLKESRGKFTNIKNKTISCRSFSMYIYNIYNVHGLQDSRILSKTRCATHTVYDPNGFDRFSIIEIAGNKYGHLRHK